MRSHLVHVGSGCAFATTQLWPFQSLIEAHSPAPVTSSGGRRYATGTCQLRRRTRQCFSRCACFCKLVYLASHPSHLGPAPSHLVSQTCCCDHSLHSNQCTSPSGVTPLSRKPLQPHTWCDLLLRSFMSVSATWRLRAPLAISSST